MLPLTHQLFLTSSASTYVEAYRNQMTGGLYKGRTAKTGAPPSHAVVSKLGEREVRQACILVVETLFVSLTDHRRLGREEFTDVKTDLLNLDVEKTEMNGQEVWVVW